MTVELPADLETVELFGVKRKLGVISGEVTESSTWSETHISGGGGSTRFGSGSVGPVTSRVVEKQRVFIKDDDGNEHAWTFRDLPLPVKQGHRVSLLHFTENRLNPFLAACNHNLDQWVPINNEIKRELGVGVLWVLGGWVFLAIVLFWMYSTLSSWSDWAIREDGLMFGIRAVLTGLLPLVSMKVIRIVRVRQFRQLLPRIISEIRKQA